MSQKEIEAAWKVLRLNLRDASMQFAERHRARVSALPSLAVDPEKVVTLVKAISDEMDALAQGGEKSPVLRALKKQFLPNDTEKTRKRLTKAFDEYLKKWQASPPKSP